MDDENDTTNKREGDAKIKLEDLIDQVGLKILLFDFVVFVVSQWDF